MQNQGYFQSVYYNTADHGFYIKTFQNKDLFYAICGVAKYTQLPPWK